MNVPCYHLIQYVRYPYAIASGCFMVVALACGTFPSPEARRSSSVWSRSECCVHGSGLINEGDRGRLRYRSILLSIYLIGDRHEESGARAPGALPGRIIGVLREPIFHSQGLRLE